MRYKNLIRFVIVIVVALLAGRSQAQHANNIDISSFRLHIDGGKLLITWTASGESANYFEIEKSTDGRNFKTFAYVMGPDPLKSPDNFGFYDRQTGNRTYYYRVKHISTSGNADYSEILSTANKNI